MGIEVYNTHRPDETSRPSNVTWVELDANKIINELKYDLADPQFDINTKNFKFYCMRSFIDNVEINNCPTCITDEEEIKNEKEQERRKNEVEKLIRKNKLKQENIDMERLELEREENIKRQKLWEEDEEKRKSILKEENIKRQKQWEEDEEKRKIILNGTESKLKWVEKEIKKIDKLFRERKFSLNKIWEQQRENTIKKNIAELQKLKEDEQILESSKKEMTIQKEKLLVDIKQLKATIQINKFPLIKPSLIYI